MSGKVALATPDRRLCRNVIFMGGTGLYEYELYEVMDIEQCTPSLSQANRMKRMSQSESLDMDAMFSILEQEKPNQREQIKLRTDSVAKYFPEDYTPKQKTDLIERLLKEWYEKQEREKKQGSDSSRGRAR